LASHELIDILEKVPLFKNCEPAIFYELILRFRLQVYGPGEFVCHRNEVGKVGAFSLLKKAAEI
jgi:hypothetical protein